MAAKVCRWLSVTQVQQTLGGRKLLSQQLSHAQHTYKTLWHAGRQTELEAMRSGQATEEVAPLSGSAA